MKRNEFLLEVLGTVDERYIPPLPETKKNRPLTRYAKIGGGVAAALLVGFAAVKTVPLLMKPEKLTISGEMEDYAEKESEIALPETEDLPETIGDMTNPYSYSIDDLPTFTTEMHPGDMGFEGMLAYSIDELENGNPWQEIPDSVTEMPVYENLNYDPSGESSYYSPEQIAEIGDNVSSTLDPADDDESIKVDVLPNGTVSVYFHPSRSLPDEYSFTRRDTAADEAVLTVEYLADRYAAFLGYDDAEAAVSSEYGVDFTGDGAYSSTDYGVYENDSDPIQKLLNYSLEVARFYPDEGGALYMVRKYPGLETVSFIGNYPIITEEEAKELLISGEYFTTVPEDRLTDEGITDETVDKVEMVYRSAPREQYVLPYYRFYVQIKDPAWSTDLLPVTSDDAETVHPETLHNWGIYYVPAVRSEYFDDFPIAALISRSQP